MIELSKQAAPLITIVLPVYNGGEYLLKSVASVLNQTFTNFELLILDDCSKDGSLLYLQSINDSRVTLFINEKNKGLFYNLNFLINKSTSGLIKLWAQDDIMYPHCIGSFVAFHNQYPNLGFSYSQRDIINEKGIVKSIANDDPTPIIVSPNLHARIAYFTGSIAGNIANVCISKKALGEVGLFKENMKISADFDMWVRLAEKHDTGYIKDKLIQLRDHEEQLSRNESLYIFHLKEDLEIYRYLDNYVDSNIREAGKQMMRRYKLVFYYTLMVKALLKLNFKTVYLFYKELSSYDNFFLLTISFIKAKMNKKSKPNLF